MLDEATGKWGLRVNRVEIKAIDPPKTIKDAMEKQMRAERDKRAAILSAEGQRQSQILTAEGDKQGAILRAEGDRTAAILKAEGQSRAIDEVFQAVHRNDPDPKLLAYQYLQVLPQLAQGEGNTFWVIPSEVTSALQGVSRAFTEALPRSPATRERTPSDELAAQRRRRRGAGRRGRRRGRRRRRRARRSPADRDRLDRRPHQRRTVPALRRPATDRGRRGPAVGAARKPRPARRLMRRLLTRSWDDDVLSQAASAAFWQTLSLPPLLLGLFGVLGYVERWFGPDTVVAVQQWIIRTTSGVFSRNAVDEILVPTVAEILTTARGEVVSVGFLLSFWSGSSAMAAFVDAITRAHDQYPVRSWAWQRTLAILLYLAGLAVGIVLLPIAALGPDRLLPLLPDGLEQAARALVNVVYYPVVVVVLVLVLTTFYKIALPFKMPWHRGLPGAVLAAVVFLVGADEPAAVPRLDHRHRLHLRSVGGADRLPARHVLHRARGDPRRAPQRVGPGALARPAAPPRPAGRGRHRLRAAVGRHRRRPPPQRKRTPRPGRGGGAPTTHRWTARRQRTGVDYFVGSIGCGWSRLSSRCEGSNGTRPTNR